jgi:hypothetical protein
MHPDIDQRRRQSHAFVEFHDGKPLWDVRWKMRRRRLPAIVNV